MLDALEIPPAWLPPVLESPAVSGTTATGVPVAAGAGDCAAAALGVGVDRPGPASVVLGTSGVVFATLPDISPGRAGARARLLPRRPGHVACDGRDALRGRLAPVAPRHDRAGRVLRGADRRGGGLAARAPKASSSCPTCRERERRTRIRTPAALSQGSSSGTIAARSCAQCSRVWPSGSATRSTFCAAWGLRCRARGRPAAGRARSSGCGSVHRCSKSRSSARSPRKARHSAPRSLAASPAASSPTCTRLSPQRCTSRTSSSPTPNGLGVYGEQQQRYRALYPALRDLERSTVEG